MLIFIFNASDEIYFSRNDRFMLKPRFKYLAYTITFYGCILLTEENQIGPTRRLHDPGRHHPHFRRRGSHTAGSGRRALPPESGAGRNRLPEVLPRLTQPPHARDNPSQQYRPVHRAAFFCNQKTSLLGSFDCKLLKPLLGRFRPANHKKQCQRSAPVSPALNKVPNRHTNQWAQ